MVIKRMLAKLKGEKRICRLFHERAVVNAVPSIIGARRVAVNNSSETPSLILGRIRAKSNMFTLGKLVFLVLILGMLSVQEAHTAQLKSVQSGTTTIADGNSSATATITAVDPAKTFLVFGTRLHRFEL